jgi:hypothetical protein
MAVDAMMLDPMLNPFKGMLAEVDAKGLAGEDVDAMRAALARLDQLGAESADITTFMAAITNENLFMAFSDAYGRALAGAAKAGAEESAGDDASMIANTVTALKGVLSSIPDEPQNAAYRDALRQAIALGEAGLSYPVFLRRLDEEGLSDAMEGSTMTRAGIVAEIHFAAEAHRPLDLERRIAQLRAYDALAGKAKFGAPDNLVYTLAADGIDGEYAPKQARWDAMEDRWERILDMVVDWLDAHAAFAFYDSRWRLPGCSDEDVRENIRHDKECLPGYLAVREGIFREYFGLGFDDIFAHETFVNARDANWLEYSSSRIELARATRPVMAPGAVAPDELVKKSEAMREAKADLNPDRAVRTSLPIPAGIA